MASGTVILALMQQNMPSAPLPAAGFDALVHSTLLLRINLKQCLVGQGMQGVERGHRAGFIMASGLDSQLCLSRVQIQKWVGEALKLIVIPDSVPPCSYLIYSC